jgi:hypothetical protein
VSRRRPPPLPEPDKPVAEMTPTEHDDYVAKVRRAIRDDEVRRGARRPRTMREMEIRHQAIVEQDERLIRRAARAERRSQRQDGDGA